MLMKCKTCSKEFIPPRKNVRNCAKRIIFKKQKNIEEASIKEEDEEEVNFDEYEIEDETNNDSKASEQDNDTIEQQPTISNQFSNGEMMCGSVIIDDSSNTNQVSIKQYISLINNGMNTLLNQSKLYTDATEIDSSDTITDNLKIIYEKVDKLNKSIKPNDDSNEKVLSLLKIINHKIDDNSHRLNELKNTLI